MKTKNSESSEQVRLDLEKDKLSQEDAPEIVEVDLGESGIKAQVFNTTKVLKGLLEEIEQYPILHGPNAKQQDQT